MWLGWALAARCALEVGRGVSSNESRQIGIQNRYERAAERALQMLRGRLCLAPQGPTLASTLNAYLMSAVKHYRRRWFELLETYGAVVRLDRLKHDGLRFSLAGSLLVAR